MKILKHKTKSDLFIKTTPLSDGYLETNLLGDYIGHFIPPHFINLDEWEELEDVILSFLGGSNTYLKNRLLVLNRKGTYNILDSTTPDEGWTLKQMLEMGECVESGHFFINSVKRKDGLIITKGDKVSIYGKEYTIREIIYEYAAFRFKVVEVEGVYKIDLIKEVIKPKDFLVTKLRNSTNYNIYSLDKDNYFINPNYKSTYIPYLIGISRYEILEFKILSTEEYFRKGVYVTCSACEGKYMIESIQFEKGEIFVNLSVLGKCNLDGLKLVKVPLFVSEDGFEVFEGEQWYYVVEGGVGVKTTNTLVYRGFSPRLVKQFKNLSNALDYSVENALIRNKERDARILKQENAKKKYSFDGINKAFEEMKKRLTSSNEDTWNTYIDEFFKELNK